MTSKTGGETGWGDRYRLVASEKWKAKSAVMGRPATDALVDYAQPKPGMQVLDVASGTGEPAITLATRIGPEGHVTALDLSDDLLKIARERGQARGLTNLTTKQADAHSLPFPDNSFDLATSRFGVMFFDDCVRALRELHRVLRPGARACFLTWGKFEQPYWESTMGVAHRRVGGPLLAPGTANPFRFAEAGALPSLLQDAGFSAVVEDFRTVPWEWPGSVEEVWEQAQAVSVPFRPMLERVREEDWPALNAEVHAAVGKYFDGEKISFGAVVGFASGTRS